MSVFHEIIMRVQQQELDKEEARIKAERDKRRLLRLQESGKQSLTAGELLAKLAGAVEEDPVLANPQGEASHVPIKPAGGGFPPPPTERSSTGS
jgi:hypothetical protein